MLKIPPINTAFVAKPGFPSLRRKAAINCVNKKLRITNLIDKI
ncbi:hypothetical protein [Faecalitalea cylindroides]|nr:hypothetical protein [Faecalitalea cylindroides]